MISFRTGKPSDVALLQELNDEVFVDNSKYVSDLDLTWAKGEHGSKYFTDLVNDTQKLCIIAESDGVAVGYLAAGPKSFAYKLRKYSELENMGVTPKFQSQGIGSELLARYLAWSKEQGYESAHVSAFYKNNKALAFYRKHGFIEADISLEREL